MEVLGWRGVNYPRPLGSHATIVVIPFMSEFMSLEWVRTPTILLYWALVGAGSLSKVKIDKNMGETIWDLHVKKSQHFLKLN